MRISQEFDVRISCCFEIARNSAKVDTRLIDGVSNGPSEHLRAYMYRGIKWPLTISKCSQNLVLALFARTIEMGARFLVLAKFSQLLVCSNSRLLEISLIVLCRFLWTEIYVSFQDTELEVPKRLHFIYV